MTERGDTLYLGNFYARLLIRKGVKVIFRYRMDPVPGIRKINWSFSDYYKNPRHIQERRWYYAFPEYVRGKRSPKNLPNPWDNYSRSDLRTRKSWKSKKVRKQWMKNL